jgi:hypothetical protein
MFAPINQTGTTFKVHVLNGTDIVPNALIKIWSTSSNGADTTSEFFKYAFTDSNGDVTLYQQSQEQRNVVLV